MKKIFAIALTICVLASTLCLAVLAADAPSDVVLRLGAEKRDSPLAIIESYIELIIAIVALVASIVSIILIKTSEKRKEASKSAKKETEKEEK